MKPAVVELAQAFQLAPGMSSAETVTISVLLLSVLGASLLGSLHCVGMCGPLMVLAGGGQSHSRPWLQSLYHLGRLMAYLTLGALAGALGRALDLSGTAFGLQRLALTLTGVWLVGAGVLRFARAFDLWPKGVTLERQPGPFRRWIQGLAGRLSVSVRRWPPGLRPLGLGLVSAGLPCGWLYAFVAVAAGQGDVPRGMAVLGAFWLGGLPAMALLGVALGRFQRLPGRWPQFLGASLLLILGGLALVGRSRLGPLTTAQPALDLESALRVEPACCHGGNHD